MSYNGSGTFIINSTGQPVVAGTVISSSVFNALTTDLANGLSTAITKDGQTTISNNIPWNSFKLTNLGAGTAATDAAQLGQVQSGATTTLTVTGTDTYVGTVSPVLSAYAAGNQFKFVVPNTNTGAATLNVSSLGAKALTKNGTTALAAGDLVAGTVIVVVYDGTRFQVLNSATSGGGGGTGTVTSVSVTSANGLAGTVANATTTPAITLSTSVTGVLKGNGTAISAAVSGTDYAPATSGSSILYGNGSGGFSNVTVGSGLSFVGGTLSSIAGGGSVTSVALSMPSGFSVSGSPITGSGTLAVTTTLSGILKGTGTGFTTATSGTDYAPATSGSNILYGNGSGGFSSVTIGSGLTFAGGTLSATGGGGGIGGAGTTNYIPKFTSTSNIGNSLVYDTGSAIGIGTTSPAALLDVATGDMRVYSMTVGRGAGAVSSNTAVGYSALSTNSSGTSNTAVGYQALNTVSTGSYNAAFGYGSLAANTASNNSAFGTSSLNANNTGTFNAAFGYNALRLNQGGSYNTSFGASALSSNVSGINNTAVGYGALLSNTASSNSAFGYYALASNNNGSLNAAFGNNTLYSNISGGANVAIGDSAMYLNQSGNYNVSVGYNALYKNTDSNNTAVGFSAMYFNTSGNQNVAVGSEALKINNSGQFNTAIGYQSLYSNDDYANTAIGWKALYSNAYGDSNTAIGYSALGLNVSGLENVAVGDSALLNNTAGTYNAAIGAYAGKFTTGSYNSSFGPLSGYGITSGSGNISVGGANNIGTFVPAYNITTQNNLISMGSTSVTNAYIQVAWTVVSDARDKTNFGAVPHGLDFVTKLNPVSYQFKFARDNDVPNGDVRYGFKAQDILELEGDNSVIIDAKNADKLYYNSDSLIPVLVNAIKELNAKLTSLEAEVAALKGA